MTTIVTRSGKGSPLTYDEMDANFTNLNTDKIDSSALSGYETTAHASSTYETISHAASTYETISHAASTYASITTTVTLNGTQVVTNKTFTTPVINGFTGDTSLINIGSNQFYKDVSGKIGIGRIPSTFNLEVEGVILTNSGSFYSNLTGSDTVGNGGYLRLNNVQLQVGASNSVLDIWTYNSGWGRRFRFGEAGQFGIGGATYGNAGQVFTSSGASSPPTWSNALGFGQSWTDVTASRALNTTYTNSTGAPIQIIVRVDQSGTGTNTLTVGGTVIQSVSTGTTYTWATFSAIVPNGATYIISNTAITLTKWTELR